MMLHTIGSMLSVKFWVGISGQLPQQNPRNWNLRLGYFPLEGMVPIICLYWLFIFYASGAVDSTLEKPGRRTIWVSQCIERWNHCSKGWNHCYTLPFLYTSPILLHCEQKSDSSGKGQYLFLLNSTAIRPASKDRTNTNIIIISGVKYRIKSMMHSMHIMTTRTLLPGPAPSIVAPFRTLTSNKEYENNLPYPLLSL